MQIQVQTFTVHKRFALTISRGTSSESTNIWLRLEHDGIEGWGEASPFSVGSPPQTPEAIATSLTQLAPQLKSLTPYDQQPLDDLLNHQSIPSAARAALDLAVHDWIGKRLNVPLWKLWGGDRDRIVPTSVTVGISSPEAAQARMSHWLQSTDVQAVKVKLGNPAGIEADQSMLKAVQAIAPTQAKFSIDANGGWSLDDALTMSHWLADQGITYIEQPLP
ncbi:MAG TPA: enolase C-terminal domain-like protein, partial [Elainellaceae cyanobacterium]